MERLAVYLPPFASDYSGVCSALYELNCLIIIDDASCCTRNYVTYDEPRWTKSTRSTFGSNLRTIEAVLGDEERLINRTIEAAQKLEPEFIALLGSPVPAIIGRDMKGIAREIEARSGFVSLGFDTTGFTYYNKGISAAHLYLLQRFARSGIATVANHVNILGLTPLDFSANDNSRDLIRFLEENNFQIASSFWMQTDLAKIRRAASAEVNLVVSQSGWAAAQYLYQHYGIPYVAATPLGIRHSRAVLKALRQTVMDKQNRIVRGNLAEAGGDGSATNRTGGLLIIGDQIMANSLRAAIQENGCGQSITVASFFDMEPKLALSGDLLLKSEKQLIELLRSDAFTSMVADPLILRLPAAAGLEGYSLPHPAISSLLHWKDMPLFIGEEFERTIQSWSS